MRLLIIFTLASIHLFAQKPKDFKWITHPKSIQTLDSLIQLSPRLALNTSDYPRQILHKSIEFPKLVDSLNFENKVQKLAYRFFKHLAYGNQVPHFDFNGISNKLYNYQLDSQLTNHVKNNSLDQLATNLTKSSKELNTLFLSLNNLLDSASQQKKKIRLLKKAINHYRWLTALKRNYSKLILVNIPSTRLRSFANGNEALQMKVIVGRSERPTRTLVSKIDQIITNPYWHLPKKIAVEEFLPKIQKDITYLQKKHIQVFDVNYQPVNPIKINWNSLNMNNFPYRLRENPYEKSTLGYLKFEFYSPFLIYLHDTSERYLFNSKRLMRSHGCVRVEKPIELAHFIFSDQPNVVNEISQQKLSKQSKPKNIKTTSIVPLIIWYSLVDFDEKGEVKFYKDVYLEKKK
jgi:hypothetical protein